MKYYLNPNRRDCSHKYFTFTRNVDAKCSEINCWSFNWAPYLWEDLFLRKMWLTIHKTSKGENHIFFTKQTSVATIFTTNQNDDLLFVIFNEIMTVWSNHCLRMAQCIDRGMRGDSHDFAELVATFISHIKVNYFPIIELHLFLYQNQLWNSQKFQIFPCNFNQDWMAWNEICGILKATLFSRNGDLATNFSLWRFSRPWYTYFENFGSLDQIPTKKSQDNELPLL